jgi:serine protease AprX
VFNYLEAFMRFKKSLFGFTSLILIAGLMWTAPPPEQGTKISSDLSAAIRKIGTETPIAVWIYLIDKGPNIRKRLDRMETSLSLQVIKRRLRQGDKRRLADFYDLPIKERYVSGLMPHVESIRQQSRWLNAVSAEVKGENLDKLAQLPFVRKMDNVKFYIYSDPVLGKNGKPDSPSSVHESLGYALDYGASFGQLNQINVPALHDRGYSGRNVLICMLDTGFNNLGHQALDHLDIRATRDFVNGDTNVDDEGGQMGVGDHGTKTLGTIAGFFPGELIGPAYGASFILGKTENTEWERHIEEDHWVAGAEWAERMGADIISSSLGYRIEFTHGERSYSEEELDGRTAIVSIGANIAASKGILIVNSAGNEGREEDLLNTINAPSDSPNVLAAGAVDPQGNRTDFSSYGPSSDGRIKPDVLAQGSQVYTPATDSLAGFNAVNGTSFSCPLTAGVAALVLEANPTWSNRNIMTALKNTASRANNPDNLMGWGIINALEASRYQIKDIHPPREFSMEILRNDFGFFIQYVDRLTWQADPRNTGKVVAYRIYSRKIGGSSTAFNLVAEVGSQSYAYEQRGRLPGETFLYKIISISATGGESDPDFTRR